MEDMRIKRNSLQLKRCLQTVSTLFLYLSTSFAMAEQHVQISNWNGYVLVGDLQWGMDLSAYKIDFGKDVAAACKWTKNLVIKRPGWTYKEPALDLDPSGTTYTCHTDECNASNQCQWASSDLSAAGLHESYAVFSIRLVNSRYYCNDPATTFSSSRNACVISKDIFPPKKCVPGFGNPIYPLTGGKRQVVNLNAVVGQEQFSIVYNSENQTKYAPGSPVILDKAIGILTPGISQAEQYSSSFGATWKSNLHASLVARRNGLTKDIESIDIVQADGVRYSFLTNDNGQSFQAQLADSGEVILFASGVSGGAVNSLRFTKSNGDIDIFDIGNISDFVGGVITDRYYSGGGRLKYTYEVQSELPQMAPYRRLISVSDEAGRSISMQYKSYSKSAYLSLISSLTNAEGAVTYFSYDANDQLISITRPGGEKVTFSYMSFNGGVYHLTGITDENNVPYASFTYDDGGNAIGTQYANGVNSYSVDSSIAPYRAVTESYDAATNTLTRTHNWIYPPNLSVSLPNGKTSILSTGSVDGFPVMTKQTQAAGSGCAASSSNVQYDNSGNIAAKDNFDGTRICYGYNARKRETVRIEGLVSGQNCPALTDGVALASNVRRVAKQYLDDSSGMVVREAAPLKLTTTVYNGQPDPFNGNAIANCTSAATLPNGKPLAVVCKEAVQATTDSNGSLGFSAAIDNSVAARIISYTYDSFGHVLTTTDPEGLTTTNTYYFNTSFSGAAPNQVGHTVGDLQSTANAAGQVTQFTKYTPSGKLLESIDRKGIVTSYTYTPRGLISMVSVTPPGGTSRTTSYAYDAVGQLISTTMPDGTTTGLTYDAAHRLIGMTDSRGNSVQYTLDASGNRVSEKRIDPQGVLQRTVTRTFDALNRLQQLQQQ